MPFPFFANPNIVQARPLNEDPGQFPRMHGLLQNRTFGFNMPGAGLLQPAADIIPFLRRQGLLAPEQPGGPRYGGGGPRIGSPEWTRAYEAQHGLRPGTLQPVERGVEQLPVGQGRTVRELDRAFATQKQQGQLERNKASAEEFRGRGPGRYVKGAEALPAELHGKINYWADRVGATKAERLNALLDAANIRSARQAWESYRGDDSFKIGIDPPGLQSASSRAFLQAKRTGMNLDLWKQLSEAHRGMWIEAGLPVPTK